MGFIDVPLLFVKTAALSGLALVSANFTVKVFKLGSHIAFFSLEKKEDSWIKEIVMREKCQKRFLDDENLLIHEKILCEDCRKRN